MQPCATRGIHTWQTPDLTDILPTKCIFQTFIFPITLCPTDMEAGQNIVQDPSVRFHGRGWQVVAFCRWPSAKFAGPGSQHRAQRTRRVGLVGWDVGSLHLRRSFQGKPSASCNFGFGKSGDLCLHPLVRISLFTGGSRAKGTCWHLRVTLVASLT